MRPKDESDELDEREPHCVMEERSTVLRRHVRVEVGTFDCEVQREAEDERRQHRHREQDRADREVPPPGKPDRRPWRDGDDDRIVELVTALPDPATALAYTSDTRLHARVYALGAKVAGVRVLLDEIAAARTPTESGARDGGVVPGAPSQE